MFGFSFWLFPSILQMYQCRHWQREYVLHAWNCQWAQGLLFIITANSDQIRVSVLTLVLLSQWSAFPVRNISTNLTLWSISIAARVKHFSACLSQPTGLSPSNLGNSSFNPLLKAWVKLGYQCCFLAEFVVYGPLFVLEILRLIGRWCGLVVECIILWPCVWGPSPVWLWVVLMVVGNLGW
jgi:hypothetical protein